MSEMVRTILIIAGNPEDRAMFRRCLSQAGDESYEFLETAGGTEGVAACIAHWPDGIVLADPLPDMTGLEFLVTLKQYNETMAWPVVLVSDTDSAAAAVQAIKGGAQDYLVKDKTLPERLRQAVQNARQRPIEAQRRDLLARNRVLEVQVAALQQEMEARYRGLFTSMQEGFLLAEMIEDEADQNVNFRYLDVNPAAERMLGLKREQIVGQTARALIPEVREELLQLYANVVHTGEPLHHEVFEPMLNQHHENFAFRPAPGQVAVLFGDVTDRKQAEEASARLAAIVSTSGDAIVSKTLDGIITSWNESAEQIFGYTAEEIIGQPILRLIPPELEFEEERILARLKAGERIKHYETVRVTKDGRRLDVSLTISPIKDSTDKIIGASKIARDITERKQAEESLRRGQQRLQMVLRAGRMGWWERDLRTNETVWSDSMYDLLGQGSQASRPSYELFIQRVHPDDRSKVQERVRKAIDDGGEYSAEYRLLHPNGGTRWVLEKGRVFYDPADQAQRLVGVSLDITQRKWVEEGLRESEAILRSFYENTSLLLGLVELDEDDIVHLYDNPATHRFYGLQAGQSTTGQRASQLGLSPAAIHEWLSHYQASAASGQPVQFEYKHDSAGGSRWLAVTVAVIGPGFSGRTRFCYVAEDITERK